MRMIFEGNAKVVTIMNPTKQYREVSRQSIADYCTEEVIGKPQEIQKKDPMKDTVAVKKDRSTITLRALEETKRKLKIAEATMLLTYLPFIEKISLLSKEEIILIRMVNKATDVKLQVSKELYNFLNLLPDMK